MSTLGQKTERDSLLGKCKGFLGKLPLAQDVVAMFCCLNDDKTPLWVKAAITSALAYFISPLDAVPDAMPLVGMSDDFAVLGSTVKLIASHLLAEHYSQARDWFKP